MALCRYMTYLPTVGRQKQWGWVRDGQVTPLDEQEVARALVSPDAGGLTRLGESAAGTAGVFALADLDVTPGRYGHPSLVAPVVSGQEVWAAGVTYESSKFA